MKNKSQDSSSAGQSPTSVKTSQKHDVNLQKNSLLYFQIGLILCLLGTFTLFEMNFETKNLVVHKNPEKDTDTFEIAIAEVKPYEPKQKEPLKERSEVLPPEVQELPNDTQKPNPTPFIEPNGEAKEQPSLNPDDVPTIFEVPDNVHVNDVQFAPIFPGCEKYELNSKRVKCLNEKMGRLVKKKFNTDRASKYDLRGVQRIYVEFKVDKTGEITDIKTRAPHPKLEEEALKLAHKIPKMKPGKMGTIPVNVIYNLPITFKVQN